MGRILISAAHTLESPGAINGDLREADLTRKILKKIVPYLEAEKVEFQTVPLDLPLLQRIEWINNTDYTEVKGDILLEVHINDGGKRGVESWYKGSAGPDNQSQKLAEAIVNDVCKKTGYTSQGAKSEYDHELGSLLILNQINTIGTAVEFLYLDNQEDITLLKDEAKLDALSKAIAESLANYARNVKVSPVAQTTQPKAPLFPMTPDLGGMPNFNPPPLPGRMPFAGSAAPSPSKSTNIMDREERKEMIKKVYKRILGKEPNQNDLNYNLNIAPTEEDLTKKLLESKDHEEIIKDATDAKELRTTAAKAENELASIKGKIKDLEVMLDNLNRLLGHKNAHITQLQQAMENASVIKKGEKYHPKSHDSQAAETQKMKVEGNSSGGLVRMFMRIFKL